MIHSMSGGVIKDNGYYTFAKVELDGLPCWYVSPVSSVEVGDRVIVPFGKRETLREGVVLKVERNVSEQCSPVPMNRIRSIEKILRE